MWTRCIQKVIASFWFYFFNGIVSWPKLYIFSNFTRTCKAVCNNLQGTCKQKLFISFQIFAAEKNTGYRWIALSMISPTTPINCFYDKYWTKHSHFSLSIHLPATHSSAQCAILFTAVYIFSNNVEAYVLWSEILEAETWNI